MTWVSHVVRKKEARALRQPEDIRGMGYPKRSASLTAAASKKKLTAYYKINSTLRSKYAGYCQ
jgi:hypothetical protein